MTQPSQESKRALALLNFFQIQGRYVMYTRPHPKVVAKRRAKNKTARQSRRHNRG